MENYTSQVVILRKFEKVLEVFSKFEDFYKWQSNLKSLEFFEGNALETGARARLESQFGDHNIIRSILLIEENSLPDKIKLRYDTGGVISRQTIRFKSLAPLKTLCIMDSEYDQESLMSVITFINPEQLRKRSEDFLTTFKSFVENQN